MVVTASCHNHLVGSIVALVGRHLKQVTNSANALYGNAFLQRWIEGAGIVFNILNNLVSLHEPIGVAAGVNIARESTLPVGRHQTERIPPF